VEVPNAGSGDCIDKAPYGEVFSSPICTESGNCCDRVEAGQGVSVTVGVYCSWEGGVSAVCIPIMEDIIEYSLLNPSEMNLASRGTS
jgi:hypothetical protein